MGGSDDSSPHEHLMKIMLDFLKYSQYIRVRNKEIKDEK
tara:strand:- start:272 stop:388 length:117 start_codon:yes stop_codon:yes gene_type:complete